MPKVSESSPSSARDGEAVTAATQKFNYLELFPDLANRKPQPTRHGTPGNISSATKERPKEVEVGQGCGRLVGSLLGLLMTWHRSKLRYQDMDRRF